MKETDHIRTDHELRRMCAAVTPFVLARRKENGGFGATPRLPATIQDTYYALNILNLSQRHSATDQGTASFLTENNLRTYLAVCLPLLPTTGITTTFQLLWSCRTAGVEFDPDAIAEAVLPRMQSSASLAEWYYCTRIQQELLGRNPSLPFEGQAIAPILARPWRCVDEAWQHLYLARAFHAPSPLPRHELIAWVQACQNGDGGFGFFPGTTSFVENCRASLQALAALDAGPCDPAQAALFLAGCQTAGGGFSRNGRAAPFLDASWHALAAYPLVSSPAG